ncbi:MAG: hypothetical protein ACPL1B_05200 [Thermoprotei archaeon]|jgi:5-hydroxyisourate hydrolase-like protein (transthyretin family)
MFYVGVIVGEKNQGALLTFHTHDENGTPTPGTMIKLYILTEKGKKLLGETMSDETGTAELHIIIPRKYVTNDIRTKKPI